MAYSSSIRRAQIGPVCPFCKQTKIKNWICLDCDQCLCDECKTVHLQVETYFNHKIVPERESSGTKLKPVQCSDHEKYFYSNLCLQCNRLVCPQCLATSHKKHEVEVIEKLYQDKTEELDKCVH